MQAVRINPRSGQPPTDTQRRGRKTFVKRVLYLAVAALVAMQDPPAAHHGAGGAGSGKGAASAGKGAGGASTPGISGRTASTGGSAGHPAASTAANAGGSAGEKAGSDSEDRNHKGPA